MVNFIGAKGRRDDGSSVEGKEASAASNLAVLTPKEFLADWELEASEAKERVIGQTMWFEGDRSGEIVTRIFCEATPKHVRKELRIDWLSKLWSDWSSLPLAFLNPLTKNEIQGKAQRKEEMWKRMKACGVDLAFTNPPRNVLEAMFPVTGRNHLKAAGVDERVFYVGGFNFGNLEKNLADFMVKFDNKKIAEALTLQWERANARTKVDDYEEKINAELSLLVDGGNPRSSIILKRAVELINEAKAYALAITSTIPPDNSLAVAMDRAAKRGVKVEDIRGREKLIHRWPIGSLHLIWLVGKWDELLFKIRRYQIPMLVSKKRGVHAKLLIVDGQVAMFGTHNLTDKGVKAGTKEWMVVTRNKELINNLIKFYEQLREEIISVVK